MSEQVVGNKLGEVVKSDDIAILKSPTVMFHPQRILILKILYSHGHADFRQLKHDLKTSDGNLASHIRALERHEFVEVHKQIVDRKPRTTYELTRKGLQEFELFRTRVAEVMKSDV